MAKTKRLPMATQPQTHAEPIKDGKIRNLSATQIERIVKIWRKIERHSNMTLAELILVFDSRPETNEKDIKSVENAVLFYGQYFKESAQSDEEAVRYAKYVLFKIASKLGQPIRGNEVPPPDPSFDGYFEIIYS